MDTLLKPFSRIDKKIKYKPKTTKRNAESDSDSDAENSSIEETPDLDDDEDDEEGGYKSPNPAEDENEEDQSDESLHGYEYDETNEEDDINAKDDEQDDDDEEDGEDEDDNDDDNDDNDDDDDDDGYDDGYDDVDKVPNKHTDFIGVNTSDSCSAINTHHLHQTEYITKYHPECGILHFDVIKVQSLVVRDSSGKIIDPLHNTTPILTKYEKTKIIGFRVSHLNDGDSSYINDETLLAEMTPENIALMELELKLLPYIIRRPLPGGKFEYWNLRDLEII